MLCVPAYTHERRPCSATSYPASFTLDYFLALTICAKRKTYGWCFPRALWLTGAFSYDCMFRDERGGGLTRQPEGPLVDTATMTTAMSTQRADSGSFSSICCAFRRTHMSADLIRLLCIRLALPLTLSLRSRYAPSARLIGVSPRALWFPRTFPCDCMFGTREEEGLLGNQWAHWWTQQLRQQSWVQSAWTWRVLAHDTVCSSVHTRTQTLFGYFVHDY